MAADELLASAASSAEPRIPSRRPANAPTWLAGVGEWLRLHQRTIRQVQWVIVAAYVVLVAVPAFLPLPARTAHVWSNLTLFAQFAFWGVWWPFVLLSMVLVGRAWCGLFCPEGALTEFVSRRSRGLAVPRWMMWRGWPFTAFACTTVYGQLISVYQYPGPALLILGGSTGGAMLVGYLYGRNKRVWCRYLCPVNGVFGLLAKLAPIHFRVDEAAWAVSRRAGNAGLQAVNCAPLVALPKMRGGRDCHMCGRCSGFRDAIALSARSPDAEIVDVAGATPRPWETLLIVFGLMGIAAGAFHWSASPWFIALKQGLAEWLVDRGILWPLTTEPPWWVLTHYPSLNDTMSLLDGAALVAYVGATAVVIGAAVSLCLALATLALGRWSSAAFHHLAQSLIPMAGCGVFLGLSALTVSMLRAEGVPLGFVGPLRALLLAGAALWCLTLAWRIGGTRTAAPHRRIAATAAVGGALATGLASWIPLFWIW